MTSAVEVPLSDLKPLDRLRLEDEFGEDIPLSVIAVERDDQGLLLRALLHGNRVNITFWDRTGKTAVSVISPGVIAMICGEGEAVPTDPLVHVWVNFDWKF